MAGGAAADNSCSAFLTPLGRQPHAQMIQSAQTARMQMLAPSSGVHHLDREPGNAEGLRPRADGLLDDLSAARGIATGVVLGGAIWCGIGLVVWLLL